ncbi:MAG: hypothetical protein HOP33_16670 [Verrucomicrobia bacterium]|nr:hypothetical protein [Verrucomicrobiota bacterium]
MKLLLSVVTVCLFIANLCSAQNCAPAPSGLVGWWRAEENTFDVQSGNFGTLMGNTTFGTGRVGQAFVFDGSGDGVSVGNPTNLQLQNFTIEAWVKRSSTSQASLDPYDSGAIFHYAYGGYGFGINNSGQLWLGKVGINAVFSSLTITDTNSFHHAVVTKSGSTVIFYLDGVTETVVPYNITFEFTGPVAIGARGGDMVGSLLGLVDEVSVYNRVLSNNEIQAIYTASGAGKCLPPPPIIPTNGLIAYYPFNGNADDASGNGNHGTVNGAILTSDRFGDPNSAYNFNGVNSDILIPETLFGPTVGAFTISLWVTTDNGPYASPGSPDWMEIFGKSCVNGEVAFQINSYGIYFSPSLASSRNAYFVSTPMRSNCVTHLVGVYQKGQSISLYTNGVLAAIQAVPNENLFVLNFSLQSAIGSYHYTFSPYAQFRGGIDDVLIYNRALSGVEIQQLYSRDSGLPPQITQQPHGTVGYWGGNALFGVGANGTAPLSYQWYKESFPISWGTNSTLTLTNIDFTDAGNYSVTITNASGSTNSAQALLVVNPSGVRLGIHPFLSITGTVGKAFGIQSTTEISQTNSWITLTNFTLTSPVQEWVDQSVDVTVSPRRFYRVVPLPNQ